jgi:hypothetical protein
MPQVSQSVRGFVEDAYQLISANSPTVPLHGNDMSKGIQYLNELLASYSANGLMLTVAKTVEIDINIGDGFITFGNPGFTPTPDVTEGRLANIENAYVRLDGVDYDLIIESTNEFKSSYKYAPLLGLPRYLMLYPETNLTTVQLFPAPSQFYQLFVYGKFQLNTVTSNDTMQDLPTYYIRYLRFALAKDLSRYKGRSQAWTQDLEADYRDAKMDMEAASSTNLDIMVNDECWLNGAWRVRSGI